jgi:hypothetical protein
VLIGPFQAGTEYTAEVSLTPAIGYTFTGVGQDTFNHTGAKTVTNQANSGMVRIEFQTTASAGVAVVSETNLTGRIPKPAYGVTPVTSFAGSQYTGTVTWKHTDTQARLIGSFQPDTPYTAVVTLSALSGYTFTGLGENVFTHGTAETVTNPAGIGTVTINFPPDPFLNYTVNTFGPAGAAGSALKLMMDRSGDHRSVTIELSAGTERITPNSVNLIADFTSPGRLTIDGRRRVLKLDDPGTLLTVGEGVTLTLRNITLMGNNDNTGPLVEVQSRGRLILGEGVTITDNKTAGVSGGVWVNGGELVMNDGAVIKKMELLFNNYASGEFKGGGVFVSNRGRFIMYEGTIGGENSSDGNMMFPSSGSGTTGGSGGVSVLDGSFDMYGGIIQFNSADIGDYNHCFGGVGVFAGGSFTMYGGTIKENMALGGGVGVLYGGSFTMNGAEAVIGYNTGQGGGGVHNSGTFTLYAGSIKENMAAGGNSGGGVYNNGTFTMHGGTIEKNTAAGEHSGGGVRNGGTFTMHNGAVIKGNKALSTVIDYQRESGGGVMNGGTFDMYGGTIGGENQGDANTVAVSSGANANGVCVCLGTFTMSGGIIKGNTAAGTNNYGVSVIRNVSNGAFIITGQAVVRQENRVFLSPCPFNNYKTVITIGGGLDNSAAANIIYADPASAPAPGTALLTASSSGLIAENYDKFLYNGAPDKIDSTAHSLAESDYGYPTRLYGVYQ